MTQEEHLLLNEIIEKQFGLTFSAAKKDFLESRLRPRLQALHLRRFIDYYLLLQYDLNGEVDHLARLITNNETYFFRETYQFEALFGQGLEELRRTGAGGTLRILCAGCSSGEEPYTLNIFAKHTEEEEPSFAWKIHAFDIDEDRLAIARSAVYGEGSLRCCDNEQRSRYFDAKERGRYELKSGYRSSVELAPGNILLRETFEARVPFDVVFCRNVLIYFSDPGFKRAITNFADVLRPGGLLFLGHSESLIGRSDLFETVRLDQCIAYRKVDR